MQRFHSGGPEASSAEADGARPPCPLVVQEQEHLIDLSDALGIDPPEID